MKLSRRIRMLWIVGAMATITIFPGRSHAQIQFVGFGGLEIDSEELSVYLLGAAIQPDRPGWSPAAGVLGYRVAYPLGEEPKAEIYALQSTVGLRHQWQVGALQTNLGYHWLSEDGLEGVGVVGGGSSGVITSGQGDYWGDGSRTAQAIASYNWGDDYLWSRLRAAQLVARVGGGAVRLGAELVAQGGGDGPRAHYEAFQVGPVVEFELSQTFRLIGAGGYKNDNSEPEGGEEDHIGYLKIEFVYLP